MTDTFKKENPVKLVRWDGGPPQAFRGTYEEVKKKAEADERTRQGIKYVII